ncbi:hypothetical protein BDQ12DRAFT_678637 [Crucibulum laeve]|uniref:Uncharacterized protein n=1 Tax=Crucibulum laeve TaxID=68775 RepID=A0A5C3M8C9_9AGAR|nr:hypothetical protein BDQ12DRAFT_678637 [Crucibulum laeve]
MASLQPFPQNAQPKSEEPFLPSFSEAVAQSERYTNRLPAYRASHRLRYHPYPRYASPLHFDENAFFNTVYDEEHVVLDVPPRQPAVVPEEVRQAIEQVAEEDRRIRRLGTVMADFIAGVKRALDT